MKTTVEISDTLLLRAKRHAARTGRTLPDLIEEGLRQVLPVEAHDAPYQMPDCSVGRVDAANPLESHSWRALRNETYGDPG